MSIKQSGRRAAILAATVAVILSIAPASAQIVFDPNNYAQNVLQAARALEQISHQVTSLQNQAQMLINQARNLASLPQSSLNQIVGSIQRTQQLLGQAQRITNDRQRPGADRWRARAVAQFRRRPSGRHEGSRRSRRQSRDQPHRDVVARDREPVRDRRVAGDPGR
jgi:P-type conjugative transfer protein TrbJ